MMEKPMCHLNLGSLMDVQERHITNRNLSEVLGSLNKGVPSPTCFDLRGWLRTGFPFFRGDMNLR
ncbi:hypothetical protein J6590_101453 [Homalodisca vitripennis]|nr:hypothetical protein J6590_101453 [Homalodisca vitripennis]